ncbi:MAG TPA: cysteine--tRNA ligase [Candidatus Paceibacterota bacterium]|jgi:cysteinyl-tRNA synthetase|nr:cysteine--tRNA ligase [Candidatus Paceibacterota bacterium]
MWPFRSAKESALETPIFFTNTLSGKKELFAPMRAGNVTLYSCGPTVYSQAHIGNLRSYVFADLIARVLEHRGLRVRRVINITDVGHLVSDADEGEDKMEKSARESGEPAEDIAARYTKLFEADIRALNIDTADILFPQATHYIPEQIALIRILEQKGFTYKTRDGVYFDTSKFHGYGKLGGIPASFIKDGTAGSLEDRIQLMAHARIKQNDEKRNPADFALWKFSPAGLTRRQQEWQSPWGMGFPGWHIECSAMSKALLGEQIDIHTGGMDHIPIHHNNEIAQSEGASGRTFVKYWIHHAFLTMDHEKVSKSLGNVVYLHELAERGYHPLALRYLFLQAHYRSPISFTWESIAAANEGLHRLWKETLELKVAAKGIGTHSELQDRMITLLRDDLATPQALALLWETVQDEDLPPKQAWGVVEAAESVLGLGLTDPPHLNGPAPEVPLAVENLVAQRESARERQDFAEADRLRIHIENSGYHVDDTPSGPVLAKKLR